MTKV
jgi:histidinol dehydrogenase